MARPNTATTPVKVIAVLLFVYIGLGLYWTTPRWRPTVEGIYRAPRP